MLRYSRFVLWNVFSFYTVSDEAGTLNNGQKQAFKQAGIRFAQLKLMRIYFCKRARGVIEDTAVGRGVKHDRPEPNANQCDIRVNSPSNNVLGKFSYDIGSQG